jgi:integrase
VKSPRPIVPQDLRRLLSVANEWCRGGSFTALRTRALIALALGSGLRLKELCALELGQVLELEGKRRWRLRGTAYLRAPQSKGRRVGSKWDSAGSFVLTKPARVALRAYLREVQRRGWLEVSAGKGPLFLTLKGRGCAGHKRLSRRAAQHSWQLLQRRATLPELYSFHSLRHTAITRFADACGGHVFKTASYGRIHASTAMLYVHSSPVKIAELAELAARGEAS